VQSRVVSRGDEINYVVMLVVLGEFPFDHTLLSSKVMIVELYVPGAKFPKINVL
jgi:hypothetical protein